jgi:hypothetical protein
LSSLAAESLDLHSHTPWSRTPPLLGSDNQYAYVVLDIVLAMVKLWLVIMVWTSSVGRETWQAALNKTLFERTGVQVANCPPATTGWSRPKQWFVLELR